MSDLEIRLEQNRKDQEKLREEETELLKEIEREKEIDWEFGEIAVFDHISKGECFRYLLYNKEGRLIWFDEKGKVVFSGDYKIQAKEFKYKRKGNIFNKGGV